MYEQNEFVIEDKWFLCREKEYWKMNKIIAFHPINKKTMTINIEILKPKRCNRFYRFMVDLGYYEI